MSFKQLKIIYYYFYIKLSLPCNNFNIFKNISEIFHNVLKQCANLFAFINYNCLPILIILIQFCEILIKLYILKP